MDRGAALNCKIIHNWDERKFKGKKVMKLMMIKKTMKINT